MRASCCICAMCCAAAVRNAGLVEVVVESGLLGDPAVELIGILGGLGCLD